MNAHAERHEKINIQTIQWRHCFCFDDCHWRRDNVSDWNFKGQSKFCWILFCFDLSKFQLAFSFLSFIDSPSTQNIWNKAVEYGQTLKNKLRPDSTLNFPLARHSISISIFFCHQISLQNRSYLNMNWITQRLQYINLNKRDIFFPCFLCEFQTMSAILWIVWASKQEKKKLYI